MATTVTIIKHHKQIFETANHMIVCNDLTIINQHEFHFNQFLRFLTVVNQQEAIILQLWATATPASPSSRSLPKRLASQALRCQQEGTLLLWTIKRLVRRWVTVGNGG